MTNLILCVPRNRLPEAIRVAETALEVAKRAFPGAGAR